MNKENCQAAIAAINAGSAKEILDAIHALSDSERLVVELVMDLTAPVPKAPRARRRDAGQPRKRNQAGPQAA